MGNRFLRRGLLDTQAADALAGVLCSSRWPAPLFNDADSRGRIEADTVFLDDASRAPLPSVETFARAWDERVRKLTNPDTPTQFGVAIDVRPDPRLRSADAMALAEALHLAEGVASVAFVTAPATPAAEWLWPLDLALLPGAASQRLFAALASLRWGRFVRPLLARSATSPIELLVLPQPLPEALRALLAPHGLPRVQSVIVLGGPGPRESWLQNAEALRAAARADTVCIASAKEEDWPAVVDAMLFHLSHDLDLDVAFTRAGRELGLAPPVLASCAGGFARAHVARWAGAVDRRLSQAASPEARAARGFRGGPHAAWSRETHDATNAAAAGEVAKQARPLPDRAAERKVQLELRDPTVPEGGRAIDSGPLLPAREYALDLWIGPVEAGSIAANAAFPEAPELEGVELTVVLVAPALRERVQVERLTFPRTGASERVRFRLLADEGVDRVEARIAILHENRVVQALRFECGVGARSSPEISFLVETVVRDMGTLAGRPKFDASLLFNDLAGQPTISVFSADRASLVSSGDVEQMLSAIWKTLSDATNRPGRYGPPDEKGTEQLLGDLARQGAQLRQLLMLLPGVREELADARRIQIVSARPERVLPIELCYDRLPPDPKARICPQWKTALRPAKFEDVDPVGSASCGAPCPEDPRSVICPIGFWATSRVIERHAYRKEDARKLGSADFGLECARPDGREPLHVLDGALCAAAAQAREEKPGLVDEAFAAVAATAGSAKEVTDWEAWKAEIAGHPRGLLVLLAHTEPGGGVTKLVIGKRKAALIGQIDERFVGNGRPLVMLLGCSTASTDRAFQSFVIQFQNVGHAAIVLGTLCEILGQHAAPIAQRITTRLKAAGGVPLGNLMLDVRRELLAQGFPIILAVAAFGDADWRV